MCLLAFSAAYPQWDRGCSSPSKDAFSCCTHLLQLLQRDPKTFRGQLGDLVPPTPPNPAPSWWDKPGKPLLGACKADAQSCSELRLGD